MAPEVIAGSGYSTASDWWSFGCQLYEMLTNTLPFRGTGSGETYKRELFKCILEKEPKYNMQGLTKNSVDLFRKLFVKNPEKRLGTAGAHEIMEHPYFSGLSWKYLKMKKPIL